MEDVNDWLQDLGLGDYVDVFAANGIDGEVLPHLSDQDLAGMGLPIGPRRKVLVAIRQRGQGNNTMPLSSSSLKASGASRAAERRQITVMFCDLVGSTALSEQLDPEDLSEVMKGYQRIAAQIVQRYDGNVAQYLGDGLMVYFGWPSAHEDDAERAIRSALEIIEAIKEVEPIGQLQVRVGIATGEVVVGEIGEEDPSLPHLAVGETPILASRLQSLAGEDQIIIAESTHRLAGNIFTTTPLGRQKLKGIAEPVNTWRIVGLAPSQGRFESRHGQKLTPFVGRSEEIAQVLSRWQHVQQGTGQAVVVSGEAGIGKSRLLLEVKTQLAPFVQRRLRFQCSPFHTSVPLYPFLEQLERKAGFGKEDSDQEKLEKLEAVVGKAKLTLEEVVPLLAPLLAIDTSESYPAINFSPQQQQAKITSALCDLALSGEQPVLIFFEDVHWIDPTSQKVLQHLLETCVHIRALIFVTHRADYQPTWQMWDHLLPLELSRLERGATSVLVESVAEGLPLPENISNLIVSKTDGIPLFVEELTQTVIQSGIVIKRNDVYRLNASLNKLDIPSTLHDSLMARLDRSAPMREAAQIGACIGRSFSHALLVAISPVDTPMLFEGLEQLLEHGLIFASGKPSERTYVFKHALVQDAAYNSLLRSKRQLINSKLADTLLKDFPEISSSAPEMLARYLNEAARYLDATTYWLMAADRAISRFANIEAVSHARQGIAALAMVSESENHVELNIALRMALVSSYRMADCYDEALEELNHAEVLALKHSRLADLARIHHLRGNIYFPLGRVDKCLAQHKASLRFSQKAASIEDEARAFGGIGDGYYMSGSILEAHDYFERCISLCQRHELDAIEISYRPMRATTHMYCLRFDSALSDCQEVSKLVDKTGRLRGEIIARNISSQILLEKQDYAQAEADAKAALELVAKTGAKRFVPLFNDVLARVKYYQGDSASAIKFLEESWATAEETSPTFAGPWILGALALVSPDVDNRQSILIKGETLLNQGCVAHNYFWFYRDAIEVSLMDANWSGAESWACKLKNYFCGKPMPWAEFIVERGFALAEWGRTGHCRVLISQLQGLLAYAQKVGMTAETVKIQDALNH
jgi:class 3 adenylate cyclase/tetratricopeptide (TPR) repeat protein/ABC-type transport system involved in cytochrome c biogenesis ATPase subunit